MICEVMVTLNVGAHNFSLANFIISTINFFSKTLVFKGLAKIPAIIAARIKFLNKSESSDRYKKTLERHPWLVLVNPELTTDK